MEFKVGERVIHPRHGLGQVIKLTMKQFAGGEKHPFYEISFSDSTLWVPLSLATSGIRRLSTKTEIDSCRQALKAPAELLGNDFRLRQIDMNDHLKEGTLIARCEIVRDLTAHGWHKSLSGSSLAFLQTIQKILVQEWAAIEEITLGEAADEIQSLLETGRQSNDNR